MDDFADIDFQGIVGLILAFARDYFMWVFGGFIAFLFAWALKGRKR